MTARRRTSDERLGERVGAGLADTLVGSVVGGVEVAAQVFVDCARRLHVGHVSDVFDAHHLDG